MTYAREWGKKINKNHVVSCIYQKKIVPLQRELKL